MRNYSLSLYACLLINCLLNFYSIILLEYLFILNVIAWQHFSSLIYCFARFRRHSGFGDILRGWKDMLCRTLEIPIRWQYSAHQYQFFWWGLSKQDKHFFHIVLGIWSLINMQGVEIYHALRRNFVLVPFNSMLDVCPKRVTGWNTSDYLLF